MIIFNNIGNIDNKYSLINELNFTIKPKEKFRRLRIVWAFIGGILLIIQETCQVDRVCVEGFKLIFLYVEGYMSLR